ncbi:MAG: DUF1570 domain-containing protein [Planctomycetota bacterium]|nr:DUF1570 domain-containing protein [Planctomycetota bacterium]
MPRRILPILLMLLFFAVSVSPAESVPDFTEYTSGHYQLRTDLGKEFADDGLAALEAAYETEKDFYGAQPRLKRGNKLVVNCFSTKEKVNAYMAANGGGSVSKGGIYLYATREANLFRQPTDAYTRHLLVHECAHQFLHNSVCRNDGSVPSWLDEGLAEYFGSHVWDFKELSVGRTDIVRLNSNNKLRIFKEHLADPNWKFAHIFSDNWTNNYPDSFGVVHFLISHKSYSRRFMKFVKLIKGRGDTGNPQAGGRRAFKSIYGHEPHKMEEALREFYGDIVPRWEVVWNQWDGGGKRIRGFSDVTGLLVSTTELKEGSRQSCKLDFIGGRQSKAGFVVGYEDTDNFTEIMLVKDERVKVVYRRAGKWVTGPSAELPAGAKGGGPPTITLNLLADGRTEIGVNGAEVLATKLECGTVGSRWGLFVDATHCDFVEMVSE